MGTEQYRRVVELMLTHSSRCRFSRAKSKELVAKAEEAIGAVFPPSYKSFVTEFGAGSFGSVVIYGVVHERFEESGVPNAIGYTLELRREGWIPPNLLIMYVTGYGPLYGLDLGAPDSQGEYPVVAVEPGLQVPLVSVAPDFGSLFLDLVTRQIDKWSNWKPIERVPRRRVSSRTEPQ